MKIKENLSAKFVGSLSILKAVLSSSSRPSSSKELQVPETGM
jgi:hypothetical protein